jgi:hypothetical protein
MASFVASSEPNKPLTEVLDILASGEIKNLESEKVEEMLRKIGEPKIGGEDSEEAEKEGEVVGEAFRARL